MNRIIPELGYVGAERDCAKPGFKTRSKGIKRGSNPTPVALHLVPARTETWREFICREFTRPRGES